MARDTVERVRLRATPDGRLTRWQAAKFLGVAHGTIANWKSLGIGPAHMKVGGRVFYRLEDLEAFVGAGNA